MHSILFNFRSRKASITTGVVERTEALKNEAIDDRLSPLNSSSVNTFTPFPGINDSNSEFHELEKFVDMDIDTAHQHQIVAPHEPNAPATATASMSAATATAMAAAAASAAATTGAVGMNYGVPAASASTRRHTVGPGDVEHEQALANPSAVPINFKFGSDNAPRLPVNLPMMQNQPLHNFTIKNQHLLKLPTVMEASTWNLKFGFAFYWLIDMPPAISNIGVFYFDLQFRFIRASGVGWWGQFTNLLHNIGEKWAIGGADLSEFRQCNGSTHRCRFNATAQ